MTTDISLSESSLVASALALVDAGSSSGASDTSGEDCLAVSDLFFTFDALGLSLSSSLSFPDISGLSSSSEAGVSVFCRLRGCGAFSPFDRLVADFLG